MDIYQSERLTRNKLMWCWWWWRLQSRWKCETAGCLQADLSISPAVFVVTKPVILRQTQDQWWASWHYVFMTWVWGDTCGAVEGCQASDRSSKQHFNICKVWNYRILLTRHHSVTTFLNMATLDIFREASGQCLTLSVATKPDVFAFFSCRDISSCVGGNQTTGCSYQDQSRKFHLNLFLHVDNWFLCLNEIELWDSCNDVLPIFLLAKNSVHHRLLLR